MASLLAMLYLVIFAALALGFYAQTNIASQLSHNERSGAEAQMATESGLQFLRYHLGSVNVQAGLTDDLTFEELYMQLSGRLDGTGNLGGQLIGYAPGSPTIPGSTSVIRIPDSDTGFITLTPEQQFRAVITQSGANVTVKVTGKTTRSGTRRSLAITFSRDQIRGTVLDYSIASRSPIEIEETVLATPLKPGGVKAGSILITSSRTTPTLELDDDTVIGGDIYFTSLTPVLEIDNKVTVAGLAPTDPLFNSHIHKGFPAPPFPVIDTSVFKPYAGNPLYGGTTIATSGATFSNTTLKNVLIKANTNPRFGVGTTLQGVIYVETPNNIQFDNAAEIRGVIAVQNSPTGTSATNLMQFRNTPMYAIETLPAADPAFPAELRALTGSAILAPTFSLDFDDADFPVEFTSTIGNIVGDRIALDEYALGTIQGSLLVLGDTADGMKIEADAQMTFTLPDPNKRPAGMYFSHRYVPVHKTYAEVAP